MAGRPPTQQAGSGSRQRRQAQQLAGRRQAASRPRQAGRQVPPRRGGERVSRQAGGRRAVCRWWCRRQQAER